MTEIFHMKKTQEIRMLKFAVKNVWCKNRKKERFSSSFWQKEPSGKTLKINLPKSLMHG